MRFRGLKATAVLLLASLGLLAGCLSEKPASQPIMPALVYPRTPTGNQVDDFHGVKVSDPYRWLEEENSPETKAWIEAENKVTFAYLNQIPERARIKERLTQLWNYERYGVPFKEGGRYFFSKNDGLQNQAVLYTLRALEQEPR